MKVNKERNGREKLVSLKPLDFEEAVAKLFRVKPKKNTDSQPEPRDKKKG